MEKINFTLNKSSQGLARAFIFILIALPAFIFFCYWPPAFEFIFSSGVLSVLKITLFQAGLSAFFSVLIGVSLGIFLFFSTEVKSSMRSLLRLPFCIPSSLAALTWLTILPTDIAFSFGGIIFVHCWLNAPWIALKTIETLEWSHRSAKEAAYSLGGRTRDIFKLIDFPILNPFLLTQTFQTFVICCSSFSVIMILGSGTGIQSLETSIFESIRFGITNWNEVSSLALWQCLISITFGIFLVRKNSVVQQIEEKQNYNIKKSLKQKWMVNVGVTILILAIVIPYSIPLIRGVFYIPKALAEFSSFLVSLKIAAITASASIFLALLFVIGRNHRLISTISMLSISFLSVAWLVSLSSFTDPFLHPLIIISGLQTIGFLPFAFLSLWPLISRAQTESVSAARALGGNKTKIFLFIEWPRWWPSIVSVWCLIAGSSLGEMAAVSFFSLREPVPMILRVREWQSHYLFHEADGGLALLLLTVIGLMVASEYLGRLREL